MIFTRQLSSTYTIFDVYHLRFMVIFGLWSSSTYGHLRLIPSSTHRKPTTQPIPHYLGQILGRRP